ncbi:major facilitator superfamily domain-containing protein, partial [Lineolata rhizophorae]
MLGFHRRTRSLIPVTELSKYDEKVEPAVETYDDVDVEEECAVEPIRADRRQLMLLYLIFLAEAIMAASFRPQLEILLERDEFCGDLSSSYLRNVLDCAYAFGGVAGIGWGWLADRVGRRPVVLSQLFVMSLACMMTGLATDLASCALLRFVSGVASSSIIVCVLTMIGDLSQDQLERAKNVARLPLIGVLGAVGPTVEALVVDAVGGDEGLSKKYPVLSGQLVCGSGILVIAILGCIMLKETLPRPSCS